MKVVNALAVFMLTLCGATSFTQVEPVMNYDDGSDRFNFQEGYTEVTLYDYHFKITAEQRLGDRLAQVIVFGQQQNSRFHVNHVEFGKMPPGKAPHGPVAKVSGIFVFQESNIGGPRRVHMTIPVQLHAVTEFTVSSDEARVEGNLCIERKLPEMLAKQTH